jgi:hypothetical protein
MTPLKKRTLGRCCMWKVVMYGVVLCRVVHVRYHTTLKCRPPIGPSLIHGCQYATLNPHSLICKLNSRYHSAIIYCHCVILCGIVLHNVVFHCVTKYCVPLCYTILCCIMLVDMCPVLIDAFIARMRKRAFLVNICPCAYARG